MSVTLKSTSPIAQFMVSMDDRSQTFTIFEHEGGYEVRLLRKKSGSHVPLGQALFPNFTAITNWVGNRITCDGFFEL